MHDTPVIKIGYGDQEVDQQFSAEAPVSDVIKFAKQHFKLNDAVAYSAYYNRIKLDAGLSLKRINADNIVIEIEESSAKLRLKEPNASVATKMANEATKRFPTDKGTTDASTSTAYRVDTTASTTANDAKPLVQVDKHLDNEPVDVEPAVTTEKQPEKQPEKTTTQPAKRPVRKHPRK